MQTCKTSVLLVLHWLIVGWSSEVQCDNKHPVLATYMLPDQRDMHERENYFDVVGTMSQYWRWLCFYWLVLLRVFLTQTSTGTATHSPRAPFHCIGWIFKAKQQEVSTPQEKNIIWETQSMSLLLQLPPVQTSVSQLSLRCESRESQLPG